MISEALHHEPHHSGAQVRGRNEHCRRVQIDHWRHRGGREIVSSTLQAAEGPVEARSVSAWNRAPSRPMGTCSTQPRAGSMAASARLNDVSSASSSSSSAREDSIS